MTRPFLNNALARRIFLDRHGLAVAPSGPAKGTALAGLIRDLGFVQVDSVNTLARAHDMILWSRRQQYRPQNLGPLLHRDRQVFEHWTHDASVIPIEYFPHWRFRFARDRERLAARWSDWHDRAFLSQIDEVRRQIEDRGACTSGEVGEGEARKSGGWWDWHPSKTALEYLWRVGEVSVVKRDGFTKVYDLTERVIPDRHLAPVHAPEATIDWACNQALDRLGFANAAELKDFYALITPGESRDWCAAELAKGRLVEVDVEGADGSVKPAYMRPEVWNETPPEPARRVRILSPFDPALRDRKRAERLFGFHYRIEIFVPAPKRKYGYYVFPVLEGDTLIGRIDVKADRAGGALDVTAFWPEAGVVMGKGRVARLKAELARVSTFAGCPDLRYAADWLRPSAALS